jgi:hypothetical protein
VADGGAITTRVKRQAETGCHCPVFLASAGLLAGNGGTPGSGALEDVAQTHQVAGEHVQAEYGADLVCPAQLELARPAEFPLLRRRLRFDSARDQRPIPFSREIDWFFTVFPRAVVKF